MTSKYLVLIVYLLFLFLAVSNSQTCGQGVDDWPVVRSVVGPGVVGGGKEPVSEAKKNQTF